MFTRASRRSAVGRCSLFAAALALTSFIVACERSSTVPPSAQLICRENSDAYFGAYELSAELVELPEQIVAQQADFMEQVVAHNQQRTFGNLTRDPAGGRWESHGVAIVTAKSDRLVSIRESWLVHAFGSPGHSMNGKIFDLVSYRQLDTETIMADPLGASRAIEVFGKDLGQAYLSGEVELPIELNFPETTSLSLAPGRPHSEGWLVPSRENPAKIGGIAFADLSGGTFKPYEYVITVPQHVFRNYLQVEYRDQFDGSPEGSLVSDWPEPPRLQAKVDGNGEDCEY